MSESTAWTILGVVLATLLSGSWVLWRRRRGRAKRLPASEADAIAATQPPKQSSPPLVLQFMQRQPLLAGLVALGIAGISQSMLQANHTTPAAFGFALAAAIFVIALRGLMPVNFITQMPLVPEPRPTAQTGQADGSAGSPPIFWTHWRYYTISDLFTGKQPDIPVEAITLLPSVNDSEIQTEISAAPLPIVTTPPLPPEPSVEESAPALTRASALTHPATVSAPTDIQSNPITITEWTGFVKPQAVLTTSRGHVIVVDVGQNVVFRFDIHGKPLGQWPVANLPELSHVNLAVSPDGTTLYIADAANRRVQVIKLGE